MAQEYNGANFPSVSLCHIRTILLPHTQTHTLAQTSPHRMQAKSGQTAPRACRDKSRMSSDADLSEKKMFRLAAPHCCLRLK